MLIICERRSPYLTTFKEFCVYALIYKPNRLVNILMRYDVFQRVFDNEL